MARSLADKWDGVGCDKKNSLVLLGSGSSSAPTNVSDKKVWLNVTQMVS